MAGRIIMNRHILTEWTRRGLARTPDTQARTRASLCEPPRRSLARTLRALNQR